jgi:hypothetical protein
LLFAVISFAIISIGLLFLWYDTFSITIFHKYETNIVLYYFLIYQITGSGKEQDENYDSGNIGYS